MGLPEFAQAARRAADAIRAAPATARWLLACDTDADGLAAGAVAALALRRLGRPFTIRASRDKDEAGMRALLAEPADGVVLLDKGSGHLALLAAAGRPVVVVDHHNVPAAPTGTVSLLNPRACGLDGSRDASASTTAVALALCGDEALAWAPAGLAGAVGDLQDEGGWRGWNLELVARARRSGHLAAAPAPRLPGPDLALAVARLEPPVPGLHGQPDAAAAFLDGLGIDRDAGLDGLSAEAQTRLLSALLLKCLAAGEAPDPAAWMEEADRHAALGAALRTVSQVADACGREGQAATGIAYLMGDKGARAEAMACLARYKATVAAATASLRAAPPEPRRAVQVAWTEEPAYSGLAASRAMELSADQRRPTAVLSTRPDGRVQASTRGTHAQVAAGMDLGRACAAAAKRAGGEGGGHPVAAGAVVPADSAPAFLDALDEALMDQAFLARLP